MRQAKIGHHIKAVADGGALYELSNVESICAPCHGVETWKERHQREGKGVENPSRPRRA